MRWKALVLLAGFVACGADDSAFGFGTSSETGGGSESSESGQESESGESEESESETGEPEPFCCGCLCADPSWSCAEDTCVTEEGLAVGLGPEAGFFEIEDGDYETFGTPLHSPRHRVWYSYHPAENAPEDAPIIMLFNGGPGSSTGPLFGFNTAPFTFDPEVAGPDDIVPTEVPWTSFANLLHVDAPATGFSYVLPGGEGQAPSVAIDPDRDAAAMVRVLVRFLGRHPDLQDNKVILLGESYGGVRATLMAAQLLAYESLDDDDVDYRDPALQEELELHFAAVFPGTGGVGLTRDQVASQFGHVVVVQGVVAGELQLSIGNDIMPPPEELGCIDGYDFYQCDELDGYTFDRIYQMAASLVRMDLLEEALGVDPVTIAWMHASERGGAYGRDWIQGGEAAIVDPSEMIAAFGELGPDDAYYVGFNPRVNQPLAPARDPFDTDVGALFLFAAYFVDVLVTDAIFDRAVYSPAIPVALEYFAAMVSNVEHDTEPKRGLERPGFILIDYHPNVVPGDPHRELRFPHYAGSGHMVTLAEPAELLADIVEWFEG